MTASLRPVPFHPDRLLRSAEASGVRVTESRHPPSHTIAPHAHERATVTLVLAGSFEEMYRTAGAVGPRTASHGDPQGDLLAGFGRDPGWGPNHAALVRFSAASAAATWTRSWR